MHAKRDTRKPISLLFGKLSLSFTNIEDNRLDYLPIDQCTFLCKTSRLQISKKSNQIVNVKSGPKAKIFEIQNSILAMYR